VGVAVKKKDFSHGIGSSRTTTKFYHDDVAFILPHRINQVWELLMQPFAIAEEVGCIGFIEGIPEQL